MNGRYLKVWPQSLAAPTHAAALALCQADGGHFPMYKTQADLDLVRSFTPLEHWIGELIISKHLYISVSKLLNGLYDNFLFANR